MFPVFRPCWCLKKTEKLVNGHVAMVRRIEDSKKIYVTHANWGSDEATRRLVHDAMPVIDVSPNNDWTQRRAFQRAGRRIRQTLPRLGVHLFEMPARYQRLFITFRIILKT